MSVGVEINLKSSTSANFENKSRKDIEDGIGIGNCGNLNLNVTLIKTSEPLKIPFSKAHFNNRKISSSLTGSSTTTNASSFAGSIGNKAELKLKVNCESPQIFSIDTTTPCQDDNGARDGKTGGANRDSSNENENNTSNFNSLLPSLTGYRETEISTSSGFNSDTDSEDSPFYSSDIDSDTSSEPPLLWNFADYFSNLPGNDWCVRIPQSFIEDEFNLFEFPDVFSCPLTLTDVETQPKNDCEEYTFDDLIDFITIEDLTEDPVPKISKEMLFDSVLLYKLIHQRFIMTKAGLQAIWDRYEQQTYGTCPRYYCHDQPLLPIGLSSLPGKEEARTYCINCQDVYLPGTLRHSKMDGVAFGPSFAHFFTRTLLYGNEMKAIENRKGPHSWQVFVPRIYGFRIKKREEDSTVRNERPIDFK